MRFSAQADKSTLTLSADAGRAGLKGEDIAAALEAGAMILQKAARDTVQAKAQTHPRGLLAPSITFTRPTTGPVYQKTSLGWRNTGIPESTRAGGKRKVRTVADYARILEYSGRYQLRHMEVSAEQSMDTALSAVENALDKAVDEALKGSGL